MDEDGLPLVGSGVDLTKVPAIQQRRTVAYLNQFVVHTVRFLNRFSTVCEEKLSNISLRIQQIETTLCILEAKLSSIPGLEDVTIDGVGQQQQQQQQQSNGPTSAGQNQADGPAAGPPPPPEPVQRPPEAARTEKPEPPAENVMTVAKDPRYARYLKMVQVGVPVMAIRNKMAMDGLDPNLLDTPDAVIPDAGDAGDAGSAEDQDMAAASSDSESSFSD
ncbi:unnamed protein product [Ophioblennius macclurei]